MENIRKMEESAVITAALKKIADIDIGHILKLLAIIVLTYLAGHFLALESLEEQTEILAESISVFVSFSIFAMTWYAYDKSKDNHSLLLGAGFLVSGFLIVLHIFSYPFMPVFITPNTPQKAAVFLIESRLALAVFFLISVYIYKNKFYKLINRPVLLAFAIILSSASLFSVLFYPEYLPAMYNPDNTLSNELKFALLITTGIILYASYLYAVRFRDTGEKNLIFLIDGSTP